MGRVIAIIAVEKEVHPQMATRIANDGSPPNEPSPMNYYHLSSIAMWLLSKDSVSRVCPAVDIFHRVSPVEEQQNTVYR